jgi:protein involved in polysaccharide export with SLBB domain
MFDGVRAIAVGTVALAMAALGFAMISGPVAAQTPTPEQLAVFKSLPPEVQKQLLDEMLKEQGQQPGRESSTSSAAEVEPAKPAQQTEIPEGLNLRVRPEVRGTPALRAGDTVLVALALPEPAPGEQRAPEQREPEQREKFLEILQRTARGNPFRLNREGALELPGLRPIVLAGLTLSEAKQRLELEPVLSGLEVELTLLPLDPQGTEALKPFGYNLFREGANGMRPAADVPVPAEYVVGPGDVLEVQLYGKESGRFSLEVGRDGRIDFPELGPIAVAGQRFDAARAQLERRVAEQLIGVQVAVSMGELRGMQVFVLGDAERPGSYTVGGLSTITHALLESGGVKPIGSLRDIQLKRDGVIVRRLDLYDVLLNGDTSDDVRLLPGDVIFVPPIGRTVGIEGAVRRPAIYEVGGDATAADLLYLAGGLMPEADPRVARLTRIDVNRQRTVVDLDLSSPVARATPVQTGDVLRVLTIRPTLENAVMLEGHVFRPGPSQYRPGLRLTDVLGAPEELKPNADFGYVLVRREIGPERFAEVVSADLAAALRAPGTAADPLLQPRDRIIVFDRDGSREALVEPILRDLERQATPERPAAMVTVSGRVKAPGRYPLEPGMTVGDLLRAGGGLEEAAYGGRAELARYEVLNGERRQTELIEVDLAAVRLGEASADISLRAHDFLSVQELEDWETQGAVELVGQFRYPGRYPIRRGETLKSVLERAGGLTELAFPEGSIFTREDLKERERKQLDELARRLQSDLATLALQSSQVSDASGGAQALTVGQQLLSQLQSAEPVGRLVIDVPAVIASKIGGPADVLLRDGDLLMIPSQSQEVTVLGEVQNAISHFYRPDLDRDDYISLSGGMTARADKGRIFVVRANGSVVADESRGWFSRGGVAIEPGDTVVVPLEADRIRPLTLWTSVTQILYNIAVAVAAVNSF